MANEKYFRNIYLVSGAPPRGAQVVNVLLGASTPLSEKLINRFYYDGTLHVNLKGILLIICDSLQRSSISFNIENLSLIRDMSLFLSTSV